MDQVSLDFSGRRCQSYYHIIRHYHYRCYESTMSINHECAPRAVRYSQTPDVITIVTITSRPTDDATILCCVVPLLLIVGNNHPIQRHPLHVNSTWSRLHLHCYTQALSRVSKPVTRPHAKYEYVPPPWARPSAHHRLYTDSELALTENPNASRTAPPVPLVYFHKHSTS